MNERKLFEIFSRILDEPIEKIHLESSPMTLEKWDSFMGYVILDEIETEFKINISIDEALEIKKVNDFKNILESKGINF